MKRTRCEIKQSLFKKIHMIVKDDEDNNIYRLENTNFLKYQIHKFSKFLITTATVKMD